MPLTPAFPFGDDVLLKVVLPMRPAPSADEDFRPGPVPVFESVTHGDGLEQLVNGPASAPARELAALTRNMPAAVHATVIAPKRVQLIFIAIPLCFGSGRNKKRSTPRGTAPVILAY
jgi:hypothetical protein